MFVSLKANRKRIIAFVVLVAVVIAACLLLNMRNDGDVEVQEYYGGTNEERISFLESFGWEVSADAVETREVMIPESFNDVYTTYKEMQIAQGFDLKPYAGYICMQYKYEITNYPDEREIYATLLVYNDLILGGDLACAEVDEFMHGFAADSARYGEDADTSENAAGTEDENNAGENKDAPETAATQENNTVDENANENADGNTDENAAGADENQAEPENNAGATENHGGENVAETVTEDVYPTD